MAEKLHKPTKGSNVQFKFPFPPYDIQNEFMQNLYNVLDEGKIGIFESPTGTVRKCCERCNVQFGLL